MNCILRFVFLLYLHLLVDVGNILDCSCAFVVHSKGKLPLWKVENLVLFLDDRIA